MLREIGQEARLIVRELGRGGMGAGGPGPEGGEQGLEIRGLQMSDHVPTVTCTRCGRALPDEPHDACPECGWSLVAEASGVPMPLDQKKVMFRDLLILQLKLVLDGLKDLVLAPLSVVAFLWDIVPRTGRRTGQTFYSVLRVGEKFDLWLNLYDASRKVDAASDGLFGESLAGANNLVGKIEEAVRQTVEVGMDTVRQTRDHGEAHAPRPAGRPSAPGAVDAGAPPTSPDPDPGRSDLE